MTDAQKRQYVSNLYSGPKWKKQVEKMPDDQIVAIYLGHVNDGTVPDYEEDVDLEALDPEFESPHLNGIEPRPPHENEDQFPMY